jgi:hypothetical protein
MNPEMTAVGAAVVIGGVGLFMLSRSDGKTLAGDPGDSLLPADFFGIGSGVTAKAAHEYGYDIDPNVDPEHSAVCMDNSGVHDPNKSLLEKLYKALTIIGWAWWATDAVKRKQACDAAMEAYHKKMLEQHKKMIASAYAAASDAWDKGDVASAYAAINATNVIPLEEIPSNVIELRTKINFKFFMDLQAGVISKRRDAYNKLVADFANTTISAQQIIDEINQVRSFKSAMLFQAGNRGVTFVDPDPDIETGLGRMVVLVNSPARFAGVGAPTTAPTATAAPTSSSSSSSATVQLSDNEIVANLVRASDADYSDMCVSYVAQYGTEKLMAMSSRVTPLRGLYKTYLAGSAASDQWQRGQLDKQTARAAMSAGLAAARQLPAFVGAAVGPLSVALASLDDVKDPPPPVYYGSGKVKATFFN